jgi:hypothetical protein
MTLEFQQLVEPLAVAYAKWANWLQLYEYHKIFNSLVNFLHFIRANLAFLCWKGGKCKYLFHTEWQDLSFDMASLSAFVKIQSILLLSYRLSHQAAWDKCGTQHLSWSALYP